MVAFLGYDQNEKSELESDNISFSLYLAVIMLNSIYIASDSKVKDNLKMIKVAVDGFNGDVNAYLDDDIDIIVFEGDTRVESSIEGIALITLVITTIVVYFITKKTCEVYY